MSTSPADKMECKDEVGLSLGEVKKPPYYRVELTNSTNGMYMHWYVGDLDELQTILIKFASGTCTKLEITKEN